MKKKTRKLLITLSIIIGIIAIGYFFGLRQAIGGFTSLSITNVDIIDDGQKIRIFGVATGAENININFNSGEINDFILADGYIATDSVTGSIRLESQTKSFIISKQSDQIFKRIMSKDIGRFVTCTDSSCSDESPFGYVYSGVNFRSPTLVCVCLYEKGEGINSEFTGQAIDNSVVSFNIGGATGTLEPSAGLNTLTLNDGKTRIEYTGSLNNYNQISSPNYDVLFKGSQYDKIISDGAYNLYKDEVNKFGTCIGAGSNFYSTFTGIGKLFSLPSVDTISSCVNIFNNRLDEILRERTSTYEQSIGQSTSFSSNSLDVDLSVADTFPTFIITLDASSVGIVPLEGEPKIVSCVPDKTINSGDTYSTNVLVQNIGNNDGSFNGQVTCEGVASGFSNEIFFSAGEIKNLPIQITGTNTEEGTKSSICTIKVTDRKSGVSDSCTSTIGVEYQAGVICEPSTKKCIDDKTIRTCSSDGKSFTDSNCEIGCQTLASGFGQCKGEEDVEGLQFTPLFYIIVAIIFIIILFLLLRRNGGSPQVVVVR